MRLTTLMLAGLILVLGTASGYAYAPSMSALEAELTRRLEEMDSGGELDKPGRKRRKAVLKCLEKLGKTRDDLKNDTELLEKIVRKLRDRFGDDEAMFEAVACTATAVLDEIESEFEGFGFVVGDGDSVLSGKRRVKAAGYVEQGNLYRVKARQELPELPGEGPDVDGQSMSSQGLTPDWPKLRSALKNMRRSARRHGKLLRWIESFANCPGRPITATESAAIEYARCQGALPIAVRRQANRVEGIVYEDIPVEARLLFAVCRPGEPRLTIELVIRPDPEFGDDLVGTHAADGSTLATARVTVYGPHGYPDHGRVATGTVTITSFDSVTGKLVGSAAAVSSDLTFGSEYIFRVFFDIDTERPDRAE